MKDPLVSIVTVVFNGAKTLPACMTSVFEQTYQNIDYVVVDGASTDGSTEIIAKQADKIGSFISEPDRGIYDAMNKGVQMAKGDWIYFLGADDVLMSRSIIASVAKHLTADNHIVYGDVLFKNANRRYDGQFNSFKIVTRNISHQSLFYPKKVFSQFKFDTRYRIFADYHLNLILFGRREWKFKYVPIVVAVFNDAGSSGSNSADPEFEKDRLTIIRHNFSGAVYAYKYLRSKLAAALKPTR